MFLKFSAIIAIIGCLISCQMKSKNANNCPLLESAERLTKQPQIILGKESVHVHEGIYLSRSKKNNIIYYDQNHLLNEQKSSEARIYEVISEEKEIREVDSDALKKKSGKYIIFGENFVYLINFTDNKFIKYPRIDSD